MPPLNCTYGLSPPIPVTRSPDRSNCASPTYLTSITTRDAEEDIDQAQIIYGENICINFIDESNFSSQATFVETEFFHNNEGDLIQMDGVSGNFNDSQVWTEYSSLIDDSTWTDMDMEGVQNLEEPLVTEIEDSFAQDSSQNLMSFNETEDSILDNILDLEHEQSISAFESSIDVSECGIARNEVQCRLCFKSVPTYTLEAHLRLFHATYIYKLNNMVWNVSVSVKDLQSRPEMETCRLFDCEGKLMLLFIKYEVPETLKAIIMFTPTSEDSFEYQTDLPRLKMVTRNIISGRNYVWDQKPKMIIYKNALMYDRPFEACDDYLTVNLKQLGLQPSNGKKEDPRNMEIHDVNVTFDISYENENV